ncbi:hypothetical protein ACO0QE_004749 [Hanseniaspora vineae]
MNESSYTDEVSAESVNETANPKNTKFSDYPEYDELARQISHSLFRVNGGISTLQQFVETLEGYNQEHRFSDETEPEVNNNNFNTLSSKTVEKITRKSVSNIDKVTLELKQINELVHIINEMEEKSLDTQRIISREKLLRDVKYSLQEFQTCQTRLKLLTEKANEEAKIALLEEQKELEDGVSPGSSSQPQNTFQSTMVVEREDLNNEELVYHQNLIRERDEEITNIQDGISELNSIFQDLNTMVMEQGQLVDNIESNIYSVAANTQEASKHLNKAMISQKRRSKLFIYLFVVLLVILFFSILIM